MPWTKSSPSDVGWPNEIALVTVTEMRSGAPAWDLRWKCRLAYCVRSSLSRVRTPHVTGGARVQLIAALLLKPPPTVVVVPARLLLGLVLSLHVARVGGR